MPLVALLVAVLQAAAPPAGELKPPDAAVLLSACRPQAVDPGVQGAEGTAFLVRAGERTLLVTASHLFRVRAEDMPARVSAVRCTPPGGPPLRSQAALAIPGAHPTGPADSLRDMAVFPMEGAPPALRLAARAPAPGDDVWLLAPVHGGVEQEGWLHHAVVVPAGRAFAYLFDDPTIDLRNTSGGAVLDASGAVVGQEVLLSRTAQGVVGLGNTLATLTAVLDEAGRAAAPAPRPAPAPRERP